DAESAWSHVEPLFAKVEDMDEYRAQVAGSVAIEALIGIGDLETAERLLDQLEEHAAGSDTAVRAFAHRARGLLHASRGDQERAIAALEAAAVEPEPPQQANPFELARIGGRTASESQLSETERQIVELVVAGRRNREVAAELSLSPNTVVWNLSKVYRKLGVSSRTELAARIAATPQE